MLKAFLEILATLLRWLVRQQDPDVIQRREEAEREELRTKHREAVANGDTAGAAVYLAELLRRLRDANAPRPDGK